MIAMTILGCGIFGQTIPTMTPEPSPTSIPTQAPTQTPTPIPTSTEIPTSMPTSTPADISSYATICDHLGSEVIIRGRINGSVLIYETATGYELFLEEGKTFDVNAASMSVIIAIGDGNNQIAQLDNNYQESDIRIKGDDGGIILNDDYVAILGLVVNPVKSEVEDCSVQVEKITYSG
jgi:hypothetical protein